jgi:hypothetical protein
MLHSRDFGAENGAAVRPRRFVQRCACFRRIAGNAKWKSYQMGRRPLLAALIGLADLRAETNGQQAGASAVG